MSELLALIHGSQAVLLGIVVWQLYNIDRRVQGIEEREIQRLEREANRLGELNARAFAAKGGSPC